ncbi:hypothetical protein AVEN_248937-1 [Araneus ventricosus]|uniref:DDB1-and CUL4-associated factor 4 n=1 Tax=Araneus ventricosus TaxID=182803 RepID=A0A4Y2PIX0_ARAVE|nr:hypothetical protein AVEN_248937-1 [Araneus ventricosus]
MTDKYNIRTVRAGILNLISQRERGFLLNAHYKTNVTNIKVNQLPKYFDRPTVCTDVDDGFSFNFLRSGTRGDLIGVGEYGNTGSPNSVCVFQYTTPHNSVGQDASIVTLPFINRVSAYFSFADLSVSDTADFSYRDPKLLLVVGKGLAREGVAVLTHYDCDYGLQKHTWRVDGKIFCCASEIHSENFVLGCRRGFYVCKSLKLSKKHHLQDYVLAAEFNNDGNLFLISDLANGIQLCDMRENIERSLRNSLPFIKEPVLSDPSFCATRMKLLSDQVTLIVSDKTGHISKVDLRMRKPVFQYSEHRSTHYFRPLNVDEYLDLLCAVGDDDYCRIWSLSSGKLHWDHKIPPTKYGGKPPHACIVNSERRWFIAVVQNETLTPLFPGEAAMVKFRFAYPG